MVWVVKNTVIVRESGGPDELTLEHIVYGGEVHKIIRRNYQLYEGRPGYSFLQKTGKGSSTGQQLSKNYILRPLCCHRFFKLSFCSNRKTGVPRSIANHLLKEYFLHRCLFATQETFTNHLWDGGQPYLCLFHIEKAFDSVAHPILLQHLYNIGVNEKLWRLIKNWYTNSTSHVLAHNCLISSL